MAVGRDPWRCPYCEQVRTNFARPGHLRASEDCRLRHKLDNDFRASKEFTEMHPDDQKKLWNEATEKQAEPVDDPGAPTDTGGEQASEPVEPAGTRERPVQRKTAGDADWFDSF